MALRQTSQSRSSGVYTSIGFSTRRLMFSITCIHKFSRAAQLCAYVLTFSMALALFSGTAVFAAAQPQSGQSGQSGNDQNPNAQQNPNQQEAPPEAGGPNNEAGPYAIPKKGESEPPPPPPERPKKVEGMPDYSIHVDVPLVTVPVMVTTKDGQFISTLKKDNFRV